MGNNASAPAPAAPLPDKNVASQNSPVLAPSPPTTVPAVPETPSSTETKPTVPEIKPALPNNPGTYEELHKSCKGNCHYA